jgi:putative hydrolase of the HAD superfamily
MAEITTVLFDLGGVVCHYDLQPRHEALAADSGLTVEEVRIRLDARDNTEFDRGEYTSEQWHAMLRRALGIKMSLDELRRVSALAFVPDAGVLRIVDAVRMHARTALFTNNASLLHEALPAWLPEVSERFDPLIFTYMLGYTKPAPEAFSGAIDILAEAPEDIVFVDDSPANVEAGTRAGMHSILYTSAERLVADLEALTGWSLE